MGGNRVKTSFLLSCKIIIFILLNAEKKCNKLVNLPLKKLQNYTIKFMKNIAIYLFEIIFCDVVCDFINVCLKFVKLLNICLL